MSNNKNNNKPPLNDELSPVTIALKGPNSMGKSGSSTYTGSRVKIDLSAVSSFDSELDLPQNKDSPYLTASYNKSKSRSNRNNNKFSKRKLQRVVSRRFDNENKRLVQRALSQYLEEEEVC